jgi:hypothetical protein
MRRRIMTSQTTITIEKARELLAQNRYGKPYKELCRIRQLIIEELIREV